MPTEEWPLCGHVLSDIRYDATPLSVGIFVFAPELRFVFF